jgi:homocitrate synthase NifV
MFKIIDRTLSSISLEENHPSGELLKQMCILLYQIGVSYIELSVPVLSRMGDLPEGPRYILRINDAQDMERYPQFDSYISKTKQDLGTDRVIYELQVNDLKEIPLLKRHKHLKRVRITGLDDLLTTEYIEGMHKIKETFSRAVGLCPQDSLHCATAIAVEWLQNGGNNIVCSYAGIGGHAVLEELLLAIKIVMHKKLKVNLNLLPQATEVFEQIVKYKMPSNKAVLGRNIFAVEAGIHADGIQKNPSTYEPFEPQLVGRDRILVIGKHSGISAIEMKLLEYGIELQEEMYPIILEKVKEYSMRKGCSLTNKEFIEIVKEVMGCEKQKVHC